jgi:hypothetical protein
MNHTLERSYVEIYTYSLKGSEGLATALFIVTCILINTFTCVLK